MKRSLWSAALLLTVLTVATACGASGARKESSMASSAQGAYAGGGVSMPLAPPAPGAAAHDQSAGKGAPTAAPAAAPAPSPVPPGPVSFPSPQATDRKIIMNAELEIKVKEADSILASITGAVRAAGGYVQDNRQTGTKQQGRTVQITLRVPAGSYDSIVSMVAKLGDDVLSRREWTNDVTAEYLDLDARIRTQETHLDQLQKLYSKGGSIKEMMELEQEISRVTADIESMKGRYRLITHQVDYSTVTVHLFEPGAPTPIKPPKSVVDRVENEFTDSWHGLVNFTGNAVVFLAGAVPILAYLAVVAAVVYLGYLMVRRRRPPSV